jgi:aminopeptidase N
MQNALTSSDLDPAFKAEMCLLPTDSVLMEQVEHPDPQAIIQAREAIRREIAEALRGQWDEIYHSTSAHASGLGQEARAARRLKNVALAYRMVGAPADVVAETFLQFSDAANMTDALAALSQLASTNTVERTQALSQFYDRWKGDALVLDKWFSIQSTSLRDTVLEEVQQLVEHADFSKANPNRFRSVIGGLAFGNPKAFHRADGAGYRFLADHVMDVDESNPQLAARMIAPLGKWRRLAAPYAQEMKAQLERIAAKDGLSKDSLEIASKSLA